MRKRLDQKLKNKAKYHPKKLLVLKPVAKEAQMWIVALERTMLTYFEIDPNSRFDMHSHASEQITMVLQGELFFDVQERTFCLKKGDVIALPSNIPHAAFTKNVAVKAVDAWSPVMRRYKDR